jgi:hypothetical protein
VSGDSSNRKRTPSTGDRWIVLETAAGRYYRVLLGQGLYAFEDDCASRSHGVWFETTREGFEKGWAVL